MHCCDSRAAAPPLHHPSTTHLPTPHPHPPTCSPPALPLPPPPHCSVVCAPPALKLLGAEYPGVLVYTAMSDAELDARGYIMPGLGDAGDRIFNTLD